MQKKNPPFSHSAIDMASVRSEIRSLNSPIHIGLTGSIATGKSTVADMLKRNGAEIIDFDILARKVVEPGSLCLEEIVKHFGKEIVGEDGSLDRKKLSDIVFRNEEERRNLERIIHPGIFGAFCDEAKRVAAKGEKKIIISVIPLLIEMKLQPLFDKIIVVTISEAVQLERLIQRNSIDRDMAMNMVRSQINSDSKIGMADFVIDNSEDLKNTSIQVDKLWERLKTL